MYSKVCLFFGNFWVIQYVTYLVRYVPQTLVRVDAGERLEVQTQILESMKSMKPNSSSSSSSSFLSLMLSGAFLVCMVFEPNL
jgi:hypothetical protein